ncbi:hypothetical protein IFM89_025424 [Coptis chinensis]|uniref:DUF4283 domain-containing protein n=1 Tax=Coptis chinensis TaxID=261450 RepID=A0A835I3E4_9MAGN|nr:hypothetical protein IFM89_025424 [Coptis chinensis]
MMLSSSSKIAISGVNRPKGGHNSNSSFVLIEIVPVLIKVTSKGISLQEQHAFNYRATSSFLRQFTHHEVEGVTKVPLDLIMRGEIVWREYVVGFFIEHRRSYPYVKFVLKQKWKNKGPFEMIVDRELFYFKFDNEEDRQADLDEGSTFIGGRCFIIGPWTQRVEIQKKSLSSIPIWVKLHNVRCQKCYGRMKDLDFWQVRLENLLGKIVKHKKGNVLIMPEYVFRSRLTTKCLTSLTSN